jgi:hypothetical protein
MPEPSLQEVFGVNATQTSTTITITKADLPRLNATADNTAESLLTGILLKAQAALPQSTFETNIDQSIYIAAGFPGFVFRGANNESYRVDSLTVSLAKLDTSAVIDPDDY